MASKNLEAVAVAVVSMLCASVSDAQPPFSQSSNPGSYVGFAQTPSALNNNSGIDQHIPQSHALGSMYVACWAAVPSQNTAYFSATFAAPAVNTIRKQFRTFVTTQFGPVSKLQCTGKFSGTIVTEQVEQWKDSARTEKNAIIDLFGSTGDKAAGAPQPQSPQAANIKQDDVTCRYLDSPGARIKQHVCGTRVELQAFPQWGEVPYPYDVVASSTNMQR